MNEAAAQALFALELGLRLSLPALGAAFAAALLVGLLQSWTRIGEPALNAIPRAVVTLLVLASTGGLIASELSAYTSRLFRALPELVLAAP